MKFLRHGPLAIWLTLLVSALALLAAALVVGSSETAHVKATRTLGAVPATASKAGTQVAQLRALAASGQAAGTDAHALSAWASQTATIARQGQQVRAGENASTNDALWQALELVAGRAQRVVQVSSDPVAARAGRTAVLLAVDQAVAIVQGLPVAPLPAPADDPLSGAPGAARTGGANQSPTPPPPPAVQMPSLPTPNSTAGSLTYPTLSPAHAPAHTPVAAGSTPSSVSSLSSSAQEQR